MVKRMDKVDVVTVGVGWSGGIVASELSKAGFKVVGLERGAESSVEDYVSSKDDVRYRQRLEMMEKLNKSTFTTRRSIDEEALPIRNKMSIKIGTDVGGGGSHWAAQTHRYFPYDFEIRSQTIERYGEKKIPDWMTIQDWGITYDELEPYYDTFEKTMGISGEEDPLAAPRSSPYPTPPLKKTAVMRLFEEATKKLGYHPFVIPGGTLSEKYENPDGQVINACQYCSFCERFGCDFGAKADPVITVIPTAKETGNFELRTHSEVKRVLYEGDKATGVLYVNTLTGEEYEQPADVVVLTSYTFNNTKLLLLSEIGKPYDPKTGKGVIGKNFTDHHTSPGIKGLFKDRKFNRFISTGMLGSVITDFAADNFDHTDVDFIHGGHVEARESGNMPIETNITPEGTPSWGKEFKKESLYYHNRHVSFFLQRASMPHKENYLDLDPTYKDDYGDPLLRITNDFTENEQKMDEFLLEKGDEIMKEMGASETQLNYVEHFDGNLTYQHNSGGVIMGDDPETSAVNNYMQMWDMNNLFVCGASAFPHFGTSNPTLTLGALTYRATEGIIDYLNNGEGQLLKTESKEEKV